MKNYAIILASGSSSRFGDKLPKQFAKINGKTILEMSVEAFEKNQNITDIIVICNPDFEDLTKKILNKNFSKIIKITPGGKTRQESSAIGTNYVKEDDANVLIHDAARPFVTQKIINDCILALKKFDAAGVAVESNDTIIQVNQDGFIEKIPQRNLLRRIQTPQAFKASIIKKAHALAQKYKDIFVTDDCGLVLLSGLAKIFVIQGDECNIKITHKSDLPN